MNKEEALPKPHVFKQGHNLDPLIQQLGGKEQVIRAVTVSANGNFPAEGVFKFNTEVANSTVHVLGNVDNGMLHIGDFWVVGP